MERYNILVVDDQKDLVDILESLLNEEYNVFSAMNGEDALAIMEENDIALVISDYRMPGMSGSKLLMEVKDRYPDAIRIILSAYVDQALLMDAVNEVYAHCVLSKPWPPGRIESTVRTWINHYAESQKDEAELQPEDRLQEQLVKADELVSKLSQLVDHLEGLLARAQEIESR